MDADRLYRDFAPAVLGWVIRLGGPRLDAEDVAHDVFATAIARSGAYRGEAPLGAWLFGITRHVVRNARRRAAFRAFFGLESAPEPVDLRPLPDAELEGLRRRRLVQRALDRLPAEHREALVLCVLEGRTAAETAEYLGIPAGTVYSRVHHARKKFADALTAEGMSPETAALDPVGGAA